MKPLRFTRHARNRMRWLRLAPEVVEACIRSPEKVTPSVSGRANYWRKEAAKFLRVTVIEDDDVSVIITVTLRRKGPEER